MAATVTTTTPYEEHREHVLLVLRRRCGWLDAADREALLHDAYAVVLEKEREGTLDLDAMHPQQVRAYLAQTALNKALDEGKRAGRRRAVALDDGVEVASGEPEAGDLIARGVDAARLHEIVAELPERQQLIIKLRFFLDRSPSEVRRCLGVTDRAYRRDLERAMRTLAERFELVREGTFCDSRRSLILAYVAGISGPNRARQARRHLETCAACAHWAAELRTAAEQAGAMVPLPLLTAELAREGRTVRGLGRGLEALRERVADLVGGARDHVAGLVVRSDPATGSLFAGVRPGAAAALIAGCLSVGSTATYCALEGFPPPVRSLLGAEAKKAAPKPAERPARRSSPTAPAPTLRPAGPGAVTATPVAARRTPARRSSRPVRRKTTGASASTSTARAQAKAQQTARVTAAEFGVESSGGTSGTHSPSAPAPAPAQSPALAADNGAGAEFGP